MAIYTVAFRNDGTCCNCAEMKAGVDAGASWCNACQLCDVGVWTTEAECTTECTQCDGDPPGCCDDLSCDCIYPGPVGGQPPLSSPVYHGILDGGQRPCDQYDYNRWLCADGASCGYEGYSTFRPGDIPLPPPSDTLCAVGDINAPYNCCQNTEVIISYCSAFDTCICEEGPCPGVWVEESTLFITDTPPSTCWGVDGFNIYYFYAVMFPFFGPPGTDCTACMDCNAPPPIGTLCDACA